MIERDVIFTALYGSHNYNLNTPESDKDYEIFINPTFEDLYYGKYYTHSVVSDDIDFKVHDIRKIVDLFWKANPNYLEILYTKELKVEVGYEEFVEKLFEMKDEIVRMNLPQFYRATKGMYFQRMKKIEKATEGTKHLVDQYGYNTKEALHTFRSVDIAIRYALTDFTDFKWALEYSDETKKFMLLIKDGHFDREQFDTLMGLQMGKFYALEKKFMESEPNEDVKNKLNDLVFNLIKVSAK